MFHLPKKQLVFT